MFYNENDSIRSWDLLARHAQLGNESFVRRAWNVSSNVKDFRAILTGCRCDQPKSSIDPAFVSTLRRNDVLILFRNKCVQSQRVLFTLRATGQCSRWDLVYNGTRLTSLVQIPLPPAMSGDPPGGRPEAFFARLRAQDNDEGRIDIEASFVVDMAAARGHYEALIKSNQIGENDKFWAARVTV